MPVYDGRLQPAGQNLLNILPVLLGGWLYAKFQGEPFSKYIYQTLFSTCLSPLVSFWLVHLPGWWCIPAMLFSGVAIGFFVPPIAGYTVKLHQGFDLYNVGFAAGLSRARHRQHLQGAGR